MAANGLEGCVVVIPALDPDPALPEYVNALLERGAEGIVVVDDGSGRGSAPVFEALEAAEGCTVLRHERNMGKGRALKDAFTYIIDQKAYRGMAVVTADADGQHSVADVCAVGSAARTEKNGLVLGVRNLRLECVPPRSKLGNKLTSWAFRLLYGPRLEDTQTGLRGIPWEMLPWCTAIKGEKFEYEMNMLIHAARERAALREVPITVIYQDNNKGSHLRTFRDAFRVMGALVSGLGVYSLCSVASAVTDVLTFWLCSSIIFTFLPPAVCYWWSTAIARVLSSMVDFTLNRIYFGGKQAARTVVRYYTLWACQLLCSYSLLLAMRALFPAVPAVVSKALMDVLLALLSYQVQLHWVFQETKEPWKRIYKMTRVVVRWKLGRWTVAVPAPDGPTVFVCSHDNLHGPLICQAYLPFPTRPWVLHVFLDRESCRKQFKEYTFSTRFGFPGPLAGFLAWMVSGYVSKLVRSVKSIPVYRGASRIIETFRETVAALKAGDSVMIFPNIQYTNEDGAGELYEGFLLVDRLWSRVSETPLAFVPLHVDQQRKTITAGEAVYFDHTRDRKAETARVLETLRTRM